MESKGNIVFYQVDEGTTVEVTLENESIWLTLNQMASLFGRDKSVISRHLKNVYSDRELEWSSTVAKNATVQNELSLNPCWVVRKCSKLEIKETFKSLSDISDVRY
jgi:hypothetical protein